MNSKAGSREIRKAIERILAVDWDPIGVKDVPKAADEYDGYVDEVYRLLSNGATSAQVADHLASIEREHMAIQNTDPNELLTVAEKLRALAR